jgi:hypothetical protein
MHTMGLSALEAKAPRYDTADFLNHRNALDFSDDAKP